MSLYLTINADATIPMPVASIMNIKSQIGNRRIAIPGYTPYEIQRKMSRQKATDRSTSAEQTVDKGTSMRGKNTFDTKELFATKEVDDRETIVLKKFHPSNPA